MSESSFFQHGSRWVRADFHLHTREDKEFKFPEAEANTFKQAYIDRLKAEGIRVGVITNHNKFELGEFKNLRKAAAKADILLLPGVELSVNDGANGLHCLIAFDYGAWIKNNDDFIQHFLVAAFEGIDNRAHENTRCRYSLIDVLNRLEEHRAKGRDSFMVMAHVHDRSGFFMELNGGRIEALAKNSLFQKSVLGFQKFRTRAYLEKVKTWFGDAAPALLEGSDCKHIDQVGKAHQQKDADKTCYLKLGAFTFEAVKFALIHHQERVRESPPPMQDLHISRMEIEQGEKAPLQIPLSPDLNTLIGVRGGGKSSLLETLRFGLGLLPKETPKDYKNDIVRRFLGEGNYLRLYLADAQGKTRYIIRRQWGKAAQVLDAEDNVQAGLVPAKLLPTAYYGQKDIEELGKDFNAHYVENNLLGAHLADRKREEAELVEQIGQVFEQKQKADALRQQREDLVQRIAHLERDIQAFEASGLQDLVTKELNFAEDDGKLEQIGRELAEMAERLLEVTESYGWASYLSYAAKEAGNVAFFESEVFPLIHQLMAASHQITTQFGPSADAAPSIIAHWEGIKQRFGQRRESLEEEFRQARQRINDPSVDVGTYKQNQQKLAQEQARLRAVDAALAKAQHLDGRLDTLLRDLEALRQQMFGQIKAEINKLNEKKLSFRIEVTYQGDKEAFREWLFGNTKGLQRERHAKAIAEQYANPIELYRDLYQDGSKLANILGGGNLLPNFRDTFASDASMLSYRVPDKYAFFYKGKSLETHSIGQRSTALIAFVLAHEDKKLFIIDQPEDDLDNQTVAKEIISRISALKPSTQFVFATHNPNILVLGDSEQVLICTYDEEQKRIALQCGSIDEPSIQKSAINIMEGGQNAFERRKTVYQLWKH